MTVMDRIKRIIQNSSLTETQFFALEIEAWKNSENRAEQITGEKYYGGEHDIKRRKRTVIGTGGQLQIVNNLPNNRITDNQYAKMVDQKINYILAKPFVVEGDKRLDKIFDSQFKRLLKYIGEDSLNGGVSWLYLYCENGELQFTRFAPYEILPFWRDTDHTILDAAVRLYTLEEYEGNVRKIVEHVELYKHDGIYRYVYEGKVLIPDTHFGEYSPYLTVGEDGYNWDKIPLIAFKRNKKEIPLISRVKSLQDGINETLSDFQNNMQEDSRNTVLILKGYDGQDLQEFRSNLIAHGVIKTSGDSSSGVDTLRIEVNAENYKSLLQLLHKALVENANGYDAKDERMGGDPNQMNIKAMLNDLDLDANNMETEFQAAFEQLLWFIDVHLKNTGAGGIDINKINIIFNRDGIVNESEIIDDCIKSEGILSKKTIISMHPWVTNSDEEQKRIKAENSDAYDKIGKQEVDNAAETDNE